MKIFDHPNTFGGWKCPICKQDTDKPVTLIGIAGTEEGNNMKAEQFHVDCLDLRFFQDSKIIGQRFYD
jgi:hypothetical protein